ncbi:MAG: hypothetical protein ACI8QZ_000600 [Chlamydiales bacterium]|jgi:hypothetical protein
MRLTKLEEAVLRMMLDGDHPVLEALREQLRHSQVTDRTVAGTGFYTDLEVDQAVAAAPTAHPSCWIGDVVGAISGCKHGAGFVLFIDDGYLQMLEGYCHAASEWPTAVQEFKLSYQGRPTAARAFPVRPRHG